MTSHMTSSGAKDLGRLRRKRSLRSPCAPFVNICIAVVLHCFIVAHATDETQQETSSVSTGFTGSPQLNTTESPPSRKIEETLKKVEYSLEAKVRTKRHQSFMEMIKLKRIQKLKSRILKTKVKLKELRKKGKGLRGLGSSSSSTSSRKRRPIVIIQVQPRANRTRGPPEDDRDVGRPSSTDVTRINLSGKTRKAEKFTLVIEEDPDADEADYSNSREPTDYPTQLEGSAELDGSSQQRESDDYNSRDY